MCCLRAGMGVWLLTTACAATAPSVLAPAWARGTVVHAGRTTWRLAPSEAMDALCMVNLLRADPFYEEFFSTEEERADLEVYRAALGPEQRQALTHLTAQI